MSGPKTSRYTLTPQRRLALARQREEQRRRAVAHESIHSGLKRLLQLCGSFSEESGTADELARLFDDDGGFSALLKKLQDIHSAAQSSSVSLSSDSLQSLEKSAADVSKRLSDALVLAEEIRSVAHANEERLTEHLNSAIDKGFGESFPASFAGTEKHADTSYKTKTMGKLSEMKDNSALPPSYIQELGNALERLRAMEDSTFIKNYIAVTVNPLLEQCALFLEEYTRYRDEYDTLRTEYSALCGLYGYVAQVYPYTVDGAAQLREEVSRIKALADKDDEQSYISDCVDEVMEDMGYSVLGAREVTKKNGRRFRSELYDYGEGTAVSVTYSADGKISMELGGLDSTDRAPDSHEAELLCGSMRQFCKDFTEIEERLLQKGVIAQSRISLLPPDVSYAQIINTTDYEMSSDTDTFTAKKERRRTEKPKYKREGE